MLDYPKQIVYNYIMILNRYEKKIINGILDNRKARDETHRRRIDGPYKECKLYEAAVSLMLKGILK